VLVVEEVMAPLVALVLVVQVVQDYLAVLQDQQLLMR
jgi:hypothetical protein